MQRTSFRYRNYVLALLLAISVCDYLDRQILWILLEPIKRDLNLTDTALGFLSGLAFAVSYTFAGIPIARLADRGVRRTIIAFGMAAWSATTALTGFARSFSQLAFARIGVAVGEAACTPAAHSILSDYFAPEQRGKAFAILALGVPFGTMLGYFVGGWMNTHFGWRAAFLVVGLPGLLFALLVRLTLREPQRGGAERIRGYIAAGTESTFLDVILWLRRLRSFVHLMIAASLHAFYGYGALAFVPSFMMRVHGMTNTADLGLWLGTIAGVCSGAGTYLGGALGDRLAARNDDTRWYMWVPGLATTLSIPFACLFYLWPDARTALLLSAPGAILGPVWIAPTFAMVQGLVKPHMRATAAAIAVFITQLIGLGLGPQVVGILSDHLAPAYGKDSIRYALLFTVVAAALWCATHFFLAARTLRDDLRQKDR